MLEFILQWPLIRLVKKQLTDRKTATLVEAAMKLPEIKAAAAYWRHKLETAPFEDDTEEGISLNARLTAQELDRFERALRNQFALSKVHLHDDLTFQWQGEEIVCRLFNATRTAGVREKIKSFGRMTRIRILPYTVDHEVGRIWQYGQSNWHNVWTNTGLNG